ncbi:protease SohB [Chromatium okenii]|uniref:protease SohB n=1 Tax=Chromatium okenii TaxID=61644 RepID=UPI001905BF55|nr:protease SohB [Chromatium okenii]MBK1642566.1 protease SohB [Chromatium okenii]
MMDVLLASLFDYVLFLAKTLTIVLAGVALIMLALRSRSSDSGSEELEIIDLNEHYRELTTALKTASLAPKALKAFRKADRRRDQARLHAAADSPDKRLFIIDFNGDIRASDVAALRVLVTALLLEAQPSDAVLVRLDNAGGMVSEHGLAAAQLARLRAHGIALTVAVDKIAASGGYLMACVADRIIAAPFAILGSIGVLAELPNFHRLLERHGVDFELHTAGENKRTLTLFGENTEAGRRKLQAQLTDTHQLFQTFVTTYRPQLEMTRVATGDHWHGTQALELGLIDDIQTSDDFLLAAYPDWQLLKLNYTVRKKALERILASIQATIDHWLITWR